MKQFKFTKIYIHSKAKSTMQRMKKVYFVRFDFINFQYKKDANFVVYKYYIQENKIISLYTRGKQAPSLRKLYMLEFI